MNQTKFTVHLRARERSENLRACSAHIEVLLLVSYFISVVYFSIYHQKEIVINDPLYQCIGKDKGQDYKNKCNYFLRHH